MFHRCHGEMLDGQPKQEKPRPGGIVRSRGFLVQRNHDSGGSRLAHPTIGRALFATVRKQLPTTVTILSPALGASSQGDQISFSKTRGELAVEFHPAENLQAVVCTQSTQRQRRTSFGRHAPSSRHHSATTLLCSFPRKSPATGRTAFCQIGAIDIIQRRSLPDGHQTSPVHCSRCARMRLRQPR